MSGVSINNSSGVNGFFDDSTKKYLSNSKLSKNLDLRVTKDNKLTKVSGFFVRIKYFFNKKKIDEKVKSTINAKLAKASSNIENSEEINSLFFHHLAKISESQFDRASIPEDLVENLRSSIKQEEVSKEEQEYTDKYSEDFKGKVLDSKLALKLGITPSLSDSGTSWVYFLKDIKGKRLGVFKPSVEKTGANPRLKERIKSFFNSLFNSYQGADCLRRDQPESDREAIAYKIQNEINNKLEHSKFLVIPETHICSFTHPIFASFGSDKQSGSLQLFVDGKGADVITGENYLKSKKIRKEGGISVASFQQLAYLDFLFGNLDRHAGNVLLTEGESADGKNEKVANMIDNGATFPESHPRKYNSLRNQYKWKVFPEAKKAWGEEIKKIHKVVFKNKDAIFQAIEDGLNQNQKKLMRERLDVLEKALNDDLFDISTPAQLAKVKEEKHFEDSFLWFGTT